MALVTSTSDPRPMGAGPTVRKPLRNARSRGRPLNYRTEFEKQLTKDLQQAALKFAERRMGLVRRAGGRVDQLYAHELVEDALADTWMGTVPWVPAQRPLLDHVRSLIKHRSWKDAKAARSRPHISISANEEVGTEVDEAQWNGSHGSVDRTALASVSVAVLSDLRRLAAGDAVAISILDAWEDGLIERGEVMARTGLSASDYKVGRGRLTYLIPSLPESLRQTARTLLRIVS